MDSVGAGGRRTCDRALYGVMGAGDALGVAENMPVDIAGETGMYADRAGEGNGRGEGTVLIVRDLVTAAGGAVVASKSWPPI